MLVVFVGMLFCTTQADTIAQRTHKIFVESSLELVWDLLGIVGSLVGMAGSLLGVAWDCWEVLEVVGNC